MMIRKLLLFLLVLNLGFGVCFGRKNLDYEALQALMASWENPPPSWGLSDKPCDSSWVGINCVNSRVIAIKLNTMGIKGTLADDIGQLNELKILDLSGNKGLGGPLPQSIGDLKKLTRLILVGCSFNGTIPGTIGNLTELRFLDLNSNQFYGIIPPSLGQLSKVYWFDLSFNNLTGPLPVSTDTQSGLDQMLSAQHFHLNMNQFSGNISEKLFSSQMKLKHVLFDGNQLSGIIPDTIGLVQTLEIIRLDRNFLEGLAPSNLNNLSKLHDLNLANNKLTGPLPDLSGLLFLQSVDLSNNSFDPSESPSWFSEQSLTTLVFQKGKLHGELPSTLINSPALQQVILDDNGFNGTLNMTNINPGLKLVSLERNNISVFYPNFNYNVSIKLTGNPFCNGSDANNLKSQYCNLTQKPPELYSTDLTRCNSNPCPPDQFSSPQGCTCATNQSLNPQTCTCAYAYEGTLIFKASIYHKMPNNSVFYSIEKSLLTTLNFIPYLYKPVVDNDTYLQVQVKVFPSNKMRFSRSEVSQIGFDLNNHTLVLIPELGPYNFLSSPYINFSNDTEKTAGDSSKKTSLIIGLSVACPLLVALIVAALYAIKQKKRAKRAEELSRPLDSGGQEPKIKGARRFSYDELRKITNNFSQNNELGSGGYGKVYMGMFPTGQLLAIKRAQQGSMQGGREFNTEIELLSRVHHKNLVALVGFCSDREEQMLVYEFVPNGSLRDSLSGKSGVHLDWRRRLCVALDSARGLAYLHQHADPPIIHRDVKSSNILLDENLCAKVSDFGLSKLVSDSEMRPISSNVKGTLGYLDPEYYMEHQLTDKIDVYSFGVVMLELITGKRPLERGKKYVVQEVKTALDMTDEQYCGLKRMVDRRIRSTTPPMAFTKFVKLALRCVEETAPDRPTMSEVVKEIESMLQSDGGSSNSNSASSSSSNATGSHAKGTVIRHPYFDSFESKESSSLEHIGGYSLASR